jgi:hypothetical protein
MRSYWQQKKNLFDNVLAEHLIEGGLLSPTTMDASTDDVAGHEPSVVPDE